MIRKILILLLLCSTAFGQWSYQQKPMLGQQIDWNNPLTKGLVGCWLMNEGAGNVVQDLSGNGNTGVFGVGAAEPSWTAGKFGPGISAWTADTIYAPINMAAPPYTLLAWFNHTSPYTTNSVVSIANSSQTHYLALMARGTVVSAFVYDGGNKFCDSVGTYSYGTWTQGVVVFESLTSRKAYVNGGGVGSSAVAWTDHAPDRASMAVTADSTPGLSYFGKIDHVMIYNRALSASEIAELYRNPFCFIQEAFPVWWYGGIGGVPSVGQVIYIN